MEPSTTVGLGSCIVVLELLGLGNLLEMRDCMASGAKVCVGAVYAIFVGGDRSEVV